jgi:sigma-E factor negative regulatory protein RseA
MEKLSEFMDGELDARETSIHLKRIEHESNLRENWDLYHLIGDALRRDDLLATRIAQRVRDRLATEPTVLAPRFTAPKKAIRYALSAAAGMAGVALVAWIVFNNAPSDQKTQNMAAVSEVKTQVAVTGGSATTKPLALSSQDAEVEDYLLAHQAVSSFSVTHGSVPYVRTVAAQQPK